MKDSSTINVALEKIYYNMLMIANLGNANLIFSEIVS